MLFPFGSLGANSAGLSWSPVDFQKKGVAVLSAARPPIQPETPLANGSKIIDEWSATQFLKD